MYKTVCVCLYRYRCLFDRTAPEPFCKFFKRLEETKAFCYVLVNVLFCFLYNW